jgi:hypothetical protein
MLKRSTAARVTDGREGWFVPRRDCRGLGIVPDSSAADEAAVSVRLQSSA